MIDPTLGAVGLPSVGAEVPKSVLPVNQDDGEDGLGGVRVSDDPDAGAALTLRIRVEPKRVEVSEGLVCLRYGHVMVAAHVVCAVLPVGVYVHPPSV